MMNRVFHVLKRSEYPLVDAAIKIYVAVLLVVQVLLQIAPFISFLATTPFYSIQTYLLFIGMGLIVIDLLTTRKIWCSSGVLLLLAIIGLGTAASMRMIAYGVNDNIYKLCWAAVQFTIVYSLAYRMGKEQLKRYVKGIYCVILVIWITACIISLYQYALGIGYRYVVNPLSADASDSRQGFYGHRLFGIFYTLNHAAYGSLLLLIFGLIWLISTKKRWQKILFALVDLILISHIILSGSRSATIALYVSIFCLTLFVARNRSKYRDWRRLACSLISAAVVLVVAYGALFCLRFGLRYFPYLVNPEYHYEEELLDRTGLEDDTSNGRINIWLDYFALYDEVGPIGLSPGNYLDYVFEHHQDKYIVTAIKEEYPDKYNSGIAYHTHSGYLTVFVSTGWLGALALVAYIVLCCKRFVLRVINTTYTSNAFICTFLMVLSVAISAVFDVAIFFQNNPQTTVFWLAAGVLMKECTEYIIEDRTDKNKELMG